MAPACAVEQLLRCLVRLRSGVSGSSADAASVAICWLLAVVASVVHAWLLGAELDLQVHHGVSKIGNLGAT